MYNQCISIQRVTRQLSHSCNRFNLIHSNKYILGQLIGHFENIPFQENHNIIVLKRTVRHVDQKFLNTL